MWLLHIHWKDHAQYDLCDSGVNSREIINMFLVSWVSGLVENFNIGTFSDTMNVINAKLYYSLSFTCSYHFQWPWLYCWGTTMSNSFNWECYVLIWFRWNFAGLLCKSFRDIFTFAHIQRRQLTCFLSFFGQKLSHWLFGGHGCQHHKLQIVFIMLSISLNSAWLLHTLKRSSTVYLLCDRCVFKVHN